VPPVEFWRLVRRVIKPGGFVASFGDVRTYDRMVVNIEDAGFEIKDQIIWLRASEVVGARQRTDDHLTHTRWYSRGASLRHGTYRPRAETTLRTNDSSQHHPAWHRRTESQGMQDNSSRGWQGATAFEPHHRRGSEESTGNAGAFYFFTTTTEKISRGQGSPPVGRLRSCTSFLSYYPPGGMVLGPYGEVVTMAIADGAQTRRPARPRCLMTSFTVTRSIFDRYSIIGGKKFRTPPPNWKTVSRKPGHNFGHNRLSGGQKGQRRQE